MNLDLTKFQTDKVTIFIPELLKQTCPSGAYGFNAMTLIFVLCHT